MTTSPQTYSRINGWSLPLNPLQFITWIGFVLFSLVIFGLSIPTIIEIAHLPLYIITAIAHCIYLFVTLASMTIDPADKEIRSKKFSSRRLVPLFDRRIHLHVIEEFYCNLCKIHVTNSRVKHCKACNKCIENFDHHCKWLNNCVGRQNYVYFLLMISSAIFELTLCSSLGLFLSIMYFSDQKEGKWIQPYHAFWKKPNATLELLQELNSEGQLFNFFAKPLTGVVFIVITITTTVLAFITDLLLCHLFSFHIYLVTMAGLSYVNNSIESFGLYSTQSEQLGRDDMELLWNVLSTAPFATALMIVCSIAWRLSLTMLAKLLGMYHVDNSVLEIIINYVAEDAGLGLKHMTTYEFLTRQRQKNQSCGDTGLYLAGSGSPNDLESHHQSCSFHTFSIPPGSGLASVFETRGSSLQAGIVGLRDKKIKKVTENSNFSPSQSSPFPISLPSQAVTSPRPRETPNAGAIYHSSQMDISSKPHCLPALRTEDLSGIHGSTEARAPVERELIPAGSESSSSALRPNLNGFNPPVNYILPGLQPISKSANEVTSAGLENLRFVSLQHSPSFGSNQGVTSEKALYLHSSAMSTPQTPNNHIFLLEDVNSSRTRSLFVSPDGLTKKSCSLITSTNGGADKVPRSLTSDIPLSNGQIVGGRLQETLAEAVGQLTAVARALATGSREKIEKEVCTASGEYRESKSIPIKLESKAKKSLLTVRHLFSIPLDSSGRLGFGRSPPKNVVSPLTANSHISPCDSTTGSSGLGSTMSSSEVHTLYPATGRLCLINPMALNMSAGANTSIRKSVNQAITMSDSSCTTVLSPPPQPSLSPLPLEILPEPPLQPAPQIPLTASVPATVSSSQSVTSIRLTRPAANESAGYRIANTTIARPARRPSSPDGYRGDIKSRDSAGSYSVTSSPPSSVAASPPTSYSSAVTDDAGDEEYDVEAEEEGYIGSSPQDQCAGGEDLGQTKPREFVLGETEKPIPVRAFELHEFQTCSSLANRRQLVANENSGDVVHTKPLFSGSMGPGYNWAEVSLGISFEEEHNEEDSEPHLKSGGKAVEVNTDTEEETEEGVQSKTKYMKIMGFQKFGHQLAFSHRELLDRRMNEQREDSNIHSALEDDIEELSETHSSITPDSIAYHAIDGPHELPRNGQHPFP